MAITIMCVCVCTRNNVNWKKDVTLEIGRRKLILKSHSKSAAQIFEKLDRRFPHGAGRLDSNWLEDEASAQLGVLGIFLTSAASATDPAASAAVLGSKMQTCCHR